MNMEPDVLLHADGISVKAGRNTLLEPVSVSILQGQSLAITGPSGSGKTTLGRILAGQQQPSCGTISVDQGVRRLMIDQQDHFFALARQRSTYYSQRYENQGMDNYPTVREYLCSKSNNPIDSVLQALDIEHIADRKLLQLSNGERKRTQLAEALLQRPDLLVLDQPFTGLDVDSRKVLSAQLQEMAGNGSCLVLICDPEEIPDSLHQVLDLTHSRAAATASFAAPEQELFDLLPEPEESFEQIVSMEKVCVQLNGKQILQDIDWQIRAGEQWVLQGHNGAGKSTLLSLVTADNPQGYTNDLVLFDRKRGSGESIWDIKQKIGFVSPELHHCFLHGSGIFNTIPGLNTAQHEAYDSLRCMDVITSGFKDEIGGSSPVDDHQLRIARTWLRILNLEYLSKRLFIHASLGQQRELLLARALIKSPALLVLDEPCQGLDRSQIERFTTLINHICERLRTTMVYVTHRAEEIPKCVTHRLMLDHGKTAFCGPWSANR